MADTTGSCGTQISENLSPFATEPTPQPSLSFAAQKCLKDKDGQSMGNTLHATQDT